MSRTEEFIGPSTEQQNLANVFVGPSKGLFYNDCINKWISGNYTKEVVDEIAFNYGVTKTDIRCKAGDGVLNVDWQYWLKRLEWTPEQAVCLLYGINPLDYHKVKNNQQIEMLRLNAEDKGSMTPYQWQQFGIEQKMPLPMAIRDIQIPESIFVQVKDAESQVTKNSKDGEEEKPWLKHDPNDPEPEQTWYTPARYFARQLVKVDSTLLTKREVLSKKVAQSLGAVGIKKRGGKKTLAPPTVLKAFNNVNLG